MSLITEILADSPNGFWYLDETNGNFIDRSGNVNNATAVGASIVYGLPSIIPTDVKTCVSFGTVPMEANHGLFTPISTGNTNTWSAVFTATVPTTAVLSAGAYSHLISTDASGLSPFYGIYFFNDVGTIKLLVFDFSGPLLSSVALTQGASYLFVIVNNGGTLTYYINGSGDAGRASLSDSAWAGLGGFTAGGNLSAGPMQDVAVWGNVALSTIRIQAYYTAWSTLPSANILTLKKYIVL